jgi:hypothetical protein
MLAQRRNTAVIARTTPWVNVACCVAREAQARLLCHGEHRIALSSSCGCPRVDRCNARRKGCLCWEVMNQSCTLRQSTQNCFNARAIRLETMVRQTTNCDISGLEPPASDSSRCMRLMTVTAASCSRSLLHVTFACAQLGSRSPIAAGAMDRFHWRCHPRYRWHVDSYTCTKQRAAFRLATCMQHSRHLSSIAAQRHGGTSLSQKHHQLVRLPSCGAHGRQITE